MSELKEQMDSRLRGNDEGGRNEHEAPPWVTPFLAGLIVTGSVRQAAREAGIEFETAWALRRAEPAFAMYWDRAVRVHKGFAASIAMLDAAPDEEASIH